MNKYEREKLDKIKIELDEKKIGNSIIKKAYYIYQSLGKFYKYRADFKYRNHNSEKEYKEKYRIYCKKTEDDGEAICTDINETFCMALNENGIYAECQRVRLTGDIHHFDVYFKDEEDNWYYADLTGDIMHIQTGMRIRRFGVSLEQLKELDLNKSVEHMKKSNIEFSAITEEYLSELDKEWGYSYNGLYTNDVINKLCEEMKDYEFITSFFGTTNEIEILQAIIDFIMEKVRIINNRNGNLIGDVEAISYFDKIFQRIFGSNNEHVKRYKAFVEHDNTRIAKDVLVIRVKDEKIVYLYNNSKNIYEEISIDELKKMKLYFHSTKIDKKEMKEFEL